MLSELEEDVDVGDVRDLLTKVTETTRKMRSELQLHRDDGLELHECFSLDDPVVPLDLPEQWDERTGKALDMEKVVKGRLKELQKLKERGECMCMFPVRTRCRTARASSSRRGGCKRPRVMKCDAGLWLRSSPKVILAKIFSLAHHLFSRQDCLSAEQRVRQNHGVRSWCWMSHVHSYMRTSSDGCTSSCQQKIQEASVGNLWESFGRHHMGPAMLLKLGWMS